MSRYLRQDPIEGWHHITNHAVAGQDLFINDRDRYEFIRRMNEAAAKYAVEIVAYSLMGNHFHLAVVCPTAGLSNFMHYLESLYAREFNMRHGRRGALFGSEFYNKVIETDGQAIATVRYVHRNPLELAINISRYPWSSYPAYLAGHDALGVVDPARFREVVGSAAEHRDYVETDFNHDSFRIAHGVRIVVRAAPESIERNLLDLCGIASRLCAVTVQEIVAPRKRARSEARLAVALVAYESRAGFAEEQRVVLGYRSSSSLRSAVMRARKRLPSDQAFAELVAELRKRWAASDETLAS